MTHPAKIAILRTGAILLVATGLLMFLALFTPVAAIWRLFLDLAFLPVDSAQDFATDAARLLTAISGGLLAGLGAMIWIATNRVYAHDPDLGRALILPPILFWFVLDSTGSVLAGAWFNVVLNSGFLVLFALPLLAPTTPEPASA